MVTIEDIEDVCIALSDKDERRLFPYSEGRSDALTDILFLCGLGLTVEEVKRKIESELESLQTLGELMPVYDFGYREALSSLLDHITGDESENFKI